MQNNLTFEAYFIRNNKLGFCYLDNFMYAIIQTGGKQYKVSEGSVIDVEKLDHEVGKTVEISEVLMIGSEGNVQVGQPLIEGASVKAKVVEQYKGEKQIIFKKRRRHNYRRKKGHRQLLTSLKIESIKAN